MGECKMRHVSGSAALPEGLRGCISGFTRLRDREKRSIMNYPHWKDSGLKGRRMIAKGEALGSGSKTKSPAGGEEGRLLSCRQDFFILRF